ncbi:MAG: patatin-like phospholipase family protein [Anaerolineaceae bacterium]|nr:patatin-like phospholipase family protein [Anaerolineaceae bacterium]
MSGKKIKILSIDGGGIRGIIPAMAMDAIERRTGKPIAELFDLIAGTSTGGILALALTRPGEDGKPKYAAAEGIQIYEREGHRIFSRSAWRRVQTLNSLSDEKYPSQSVEAVLKEYLGDARLREALTDVLVTAYETERRSPWFFRSQRAKVRPDYDFPMWQVARATSAAPTYFEAFKITTEGVEEYYSLIDGGVFANNPTMCAFVDARTRFPEINDFMVVSLGTGELTRPIYHDEAKDWGLIQWVQPVISILMQGVNETVHYQMQQLLSDSLDGKPRYYRLQTRLEVGSDDLDNVSRTNIRVLKLLGEQMIHDNSSRIDQLCEMLTSD